MPYHRFIIHPSRKKTSNIIPDSIRSKRNQSNLHLVNYSRSSCGDPSVVCPSITCDVLLDSVDSDPAHHQRPRHDDKDKPLFSVSCCLPAFGDHSGPPESVLFLPHSVRGCACPSSLFTQDENISIVTRTPATCCFGKKCMHTTSRDRKNEFYTHIKPSSKSAEIISHS